MDSQRRFVLSLLAASASLPWLGGCQPTPPLKVASHVWPGYEFMFLARDQGWLNKQQVQLVETATASDSLRALSERQVSAAALTLDEVLIGRSLGLPLQVVLVFNISVGADQVLARPEIQQLADIKGKRVGAELSALGNLVVSKLLSAAELTRDDIELVEIDANDFSAWENQSLDVMQTYEPTATRIRNTGAHLLYSSRSFPDTIFDVLAVRTDALAQQQANLKHLMQAHFQGLQAFRQNPVDTNYRLARRLGVTGQEVMGLYRGLQLPDLAVNRSYLSPPSERLSRAVTVINQLLVESGQLDCSPGLENLFTPAYLPRK